MNVKQFVSIFIVSGVQCTYFMVNPNPFKPTMAEIHFSVVLYVLYSRLDVLLLRYKRHWQFLQSCLWSVNAKGIYLSHAALKRKRKNTRKVVLYRSMNSRRLQRLIIWCQTTNLFVFEDVGNKLYMIMYMWL